MEKIILKNNMIIYTDTREQLAPSGRKFELAAITKLVQEPEKYINKTYKSKWLYTFKYFDNRKEGFKIEIGYNDEMLNFNKFSL